MLSLSTYEYVFVFSSTAIGSIETNEVEIDFFAIEIVGW